MNGWNNETQQTFKEDSALMINQIRKDTCCTKEIKEIDNEIFDTEQIS